MESAAHFLVGAVFGFWASVFLFATLIYKASKSLPKPAEVKEARPNVLDLYPPKE